VKKRDDNCVDGLQTLYDDEISKGGDFNDFTLTSQTDGDKLSKDSEYGEWPIYAIRLSWEDIKGLPDAKRAVKALTHIEKKMNEFEEIGGIPASFGNYIQRVAKAIGVGYCSYVTDGDSCEPHTRQFVDPSRIAYIVDQRIASWRKEARKNAGKED
jgi:hypothetical protein